MEHDLTAIHLPKIIEDLALILAVAGFTTLLFKVIKQPVVLGYIIAGFLVGPSFHWFPTVGDQESIKIWAEMGVIFLLFALGLEFSFKKLARVGAAAGITATIEIVGMVAVGYAIGRAFGWNQMDSLFLGGILAISSTTIIIRAFEELGLKSRGFAKLVFGVLVVEDLIAILLMVVLSTVAATNAFSGTEMMLSVAKLTFFLILWFVCGIFLLPTLLTRVRKHLNPETLLVLSLGLCFGMVVLATKAGFSPALGAFIMGSILAETTQGEKIEHLIHPVKDLFAAVFFVSVGMMIDIEVLVKYWPAIAVITFATIFGKFLTTAIGALAAGRTLRHSIQAGMSLAQIGEFSFIIASLGLSLKVTSDHLFPIAISVSAITTFTTPYLIKSSDSVVRFAERTLPQRFLERIENFSAASNTIGHVSDFRLNARPYLLKVIPNSVVVIAIFLLIERFGVPQFAELLPTDRAASVAGLIAAFVVSSPFWWAMAFGRIQDESLGRLWRQGRLSGPLIGLEIARWIVAIVLIGILATRFVSATVVVAVVAAVAVLLAIGLSRFMDRVYERIERRFIKNLNDKELGAGSVKSKPLAPWDSHLVELVVSADSVLVGKTLADAKIREQFGISVALVERGSRFIPAPTREEKIYPGDSLHVIGTDEQIARFKAECELPSVADPEAHLDYGLGAVTIGEASPFANRTIRESGLREQLRGLVVGIEKRGNRVLNPDSSIMIEPNDVLWVVGDRKLMQLSST